MNKVLNLSKLVAEVDELPLTKLQVAQKCGISRVTLDSVLKGKEIGLYKFLKLMSLFNKNIGYFFDEDIIVSEKYEQKGDHNLQARRVGKVEIKDERGNGNNCPKEPNLPSEENPEILKERIKSLEAILAEKNERIQDLKESLEVLKPKH